MKLVGPTRRLGRLGLANVVLLGVVLLMCWIILVTAPPTAAPALADAGIPVSIANFVAVTDDVARTLPGCDAITIADANTGATVARGEWQVSPGQLATTSDASLIVSASNERGNFVYLMKWQPDRGSWGTDWIYHHDFAEAHQAGGHLAAGGAIAISPDDSTLLVPWENAIIKYDVAGVTLDSLGPVAGIATIGDDHGVHVRATIAADIEFSADSSKAYVVANDGYVYTLQVDSLTWLGDPIPYAVTGGTKEFRVRRTFAAVSRDERWLVINTADKEFGLLNLIDLERRQSRLIEMPGMRQSWGVRFNYAELHRDLLAVHGGTHVAVYEFTDGVLQQLAMVRVPAPSTNNWITPNRARIGALAWSGDGGRVIANIGSDKEWRIFGFESGPPPALKRIAEIDSCLAEWDIHAGLDVVTIQDRSPPPTPSATVTPMPTPTASGTATPEATETPLASSTPTPTATPMATPTAVPMPAFIPVAIREHCQREWQVVDVILVLDASTSMLESTSGGRSKLASAVDAVGVFLDQLTLTAGDQAAIVSFNASATADQTLTDNRADLDQALGAINTAQQTRIHLGVDAARRELSSDRRRPGNSPVIVVLTDGRANPDPVSLAVEQARVAKAEGATVFTIGLGNELDVEALREMASSPSGFYHAPTADQLAEIYRQIAVEVPCPARTFWGRR